jgi:hypothetical protein
LTYRPAQSINPSYVVMRLGESDALLIPHNQ